MRIKRYGLWLGILCICGGCRSESISVPVVNTKEVEGDMELEWEQVVKNSRLVRLETKPEVLLEGFLKIYGQGKNILLLMGIRKCISLHRMVNIYVV